MITDFKIFNLLVLFFLLYLINKFLVLNSLLVDKSIHSKHKIMTNKSVPLSGGVFILLSIVYFNYAYELNSIKSVFYFLY